MELALESEDTQQRLIDRDHRLLADSRSVRQTCFQRLKVSRDTRLPSRLLMYCSES